MPSDPDVPNAFVSFTQSLLIGAMTLLSKAVARSADALFPWYLLTRPLIFCMWPFMLLLKFITAMREEANDGK